MRAWLAALVLLVPCAASLAGQEASALNQLESACPLEGGARWVSDVWLAERGEPESRCGAAVVRALQVLQPVAVDTIENLGVSRSFRLHFTPALRGIFKPEGGDPTCPDCSSTREIAAYRISEATGLRLVPPTALRVWMSDGGPLVGSVQLWIESAESPGMDFVKPDDLRLFDAIIGNSDRHPGNILVSSDRQVLAIDHNRAFTWDLSIGHASCWEAELDAIDDPQALLAGNQWQSVRRALSDESLTHGLHLSQPAADRLTAFPTQAADRLTSRESGQAPALDQCANRTPWYERGFRSVSDPLKIGVAAVLGGILVALGGG